MCEVLSDAGFFSGLWDGLVALFAIIADIFWEVEVYNHCQQSWWYDAGFFLGIVFLTALFGADTGDIAFIVLFLLFIVWCIAIFVKGLMYFAPIIIIGAVGYILVTKYKKR